MGLTSHAQKENTKTIKNMVVQLEIKDFPKSKRIMYFDNISLVGAVINLTSVKLTESKLKEIEESGQHFSNDYVTIKYVSRKTGMRVCFFDGKTASNMVMVKWRTIENG